jgi:hypothetical protein
MRIVMRPSGQTQWITVESALYRAEDELQRLLGDNPSLLPLRDMREGLSELAVAVREFHVPGSGYVDLLGFTSTGDIAVIECKLSANPQIKREVVGQLFEYAGFLWEMNYDQLDERIRAGQNGQTLAELVAKSQEDTEWDEEEFRQTVAHNLRTGSFILVIVVDRATDELARAAAFLSSCARANFTFHVVEMHRFQAAAADVLIPQVHGGAIRPTTEAEPRGAWPKERFLDEIRRRAPAAAPLAQDLYDWSEEEADQVTTGAGRATGSFSFHFVVDGKSKNVFSVYTDGRLELPYKALVRKVGPQVAQAFHEMLSRIPGFNGLAADFTKYPSVELTRAFSQSESLTAFKNAVIAVGNMVQRQESVQTQTTQP